jgi:hypothetical protein
MSLLLEQDIYQFLPGSLREDIENYRCPVNVGWRLIYLWAGSNHVWGRRKADDWVRRAYKKAKKNHNDKEMIESINRYLEVRQYAQMVDYWFCFQKNKELNPGWIYILSNSENPGILKVGKVESRTIEMRLREIRKQYGDSWEESYRRDTITPFYAERRAHSEMEEDRINPKQEFFEVSLKQAIHIVNRCVDQVEKETNNWFEEEWLKKAEGAKRKSLK